MYNFKECKLNRRQSDLKEPPKCEFYKALSFMDSMITVGNDDVMKYPDVPDIRMIFNTVIVARELRYPYLSLLNKKDNFICSCSSGNYRENEKQVNKNDDMSDDSDSKSLSQVTSFRIRFNLRYDQFIKQVQKHECIWNENNEDYENKESRKWAWENLCKDVEYMKFWRLKLLMNRNYFVMYLEKEWKFMMYNFKECKLNQRQSNLKNPPKCEFYKALNFMDQLITVGNDDVMIYPDVPDVRVLVNTQVEERKHGASLYLHYCRMNNFRCKCSSWRRYADLEDGANEISEKRMSQPSFGENNICIDNINTSIDAPIGQTEKSALTVPQNIETSGSPNDVDQTPQHKISTQEHHTTDSDVKFSLIKQVEKQPCIWNPKHAHYKNRKKTKETWEEIRKIVKTPDNVSLKDIWKTLREDFKRCHERRNKKKEASCNFYKELKFLTDVVIKNPNPAGESTLTANKNVICGEKIPRGLQTNSSSLPKAIDSHHTSLYSDDTTSSTGVDFDKTSSSDVPVFCISDDNTDMETRNVQNADQESKSLVTEQTSSLPLTNKHDNQRGSVSCQSYQNTKEHISAGLTSSISIGHADSKRNLLACNNVPTTSSDFPKMSRKHLTEITPCFSDEPNSNPIHQQNLSAINRLPARSGASNTEHSTSSTTFNDMDPAYSDSNNPNNLPSTSTPAITGSSSISSEDNDEITNEKFKSDNLPQKYSKTNKQKRNSHPRRKRKRTELEYTRTKRASAQISNTAETKNPLASELVKSLESNEKDLLFFKQVEGQLSQFSDKQRAVAKILVQKALNKVEFMDNEQLHQTLNTI
uniref:MADF domain-containing protein n=2 Tax=Clytia hemisphaerica TaxID=252671 RepID=A0A7M5UID5_9CNID